MELIKISRSIVNLFILKNNANSKKLTKARKPKQATDTSKTKNFGGFVGLFALNLFKRQPISSKTLQDDEGSTKSHPTASLPTPMPSRISFSRGAAPISIPEPTESILDYTPDPGALLLNDSTNNQSSEEVDSELVGDEYADEGIFLLDLDNMDLAGQRKNKDKTPEQVLKDILSTEDIPHHQVPRTILPPGLCIPWGPNNPVPTSLEDFTSSDPFLPTETYDLGGFSDLNGVQQRWVLLEAIHQVPIFYIFRDNLAEKHHQQQPNNAMYGFNNFCGDFGCKVEICEHSRPNGRQWMWPGIRYVVSKLKHTRKEGIRRAREKAERDAAA
ncbi:hypothetical protein EYC80_010714 [Monilinia laxa]|uniref:Uncharacterized protein n=1 Tax=Monilinia laxa TaxID=61186 RepID=A0A5N6JMK1_MONLA|nr:hypothetical protein EYC80_010714 [Monilinia laxa]